MPLKPTYHRPEWGFREILDMLGSSNDIHWELFGKGYQPPPDDTIAGWKTRNSIPGKWLPVIIELATEKGHIRGLQDLKPRENPNVKQPYLRRDPANLAGAA